MAIASGRSSASEADTRFAVGLDIGTSSVKATVLSERGATGTFTSEPYATSAPRPGHAEQDPDAWWASVGQVFDQVLHSFPSLDPANTVLAMTGQMHTTVVRDRDGALIRPAVTWADARAGEATRLLREDSGHWAAVTGHAPIPAFTSAHLAWLSAHEPESFARIDSVAVPKDDVRRRLGAGWATDPSDASAMNLMDSTTDTWAPDLCKLVGLDEEQLPPIVPSSQTTGEIRQLPPMSTPGDALLGIPVIAGGADQATQAVALGVVDDSALGISVGTSGVAFRVVPTARRGAFRHALPDRWLALDSTHSAGLALAWWAEVSGTSFEDFALVMEDPERPAPTFLPYLQGGRGYAGAPGTLSDLHVSHGRRELTSAVLVGVALELVRLALGLSSDAPSPEVVGVGGRAAQNRDLRRCLAAGLGRPVSFSSRGSAYGAALLATRWPDESSTRGHGERVITYPEPDVVAYLEGRTARFSRLLEHLN